MNHTPLTLRSTVAELLEHPERVPDADLLALINDLDGLLQALPCEPWLGGHWKAGRHLHPSNNDPTSMDPLGRGQEQDPDFLTRTRQGAQAVQRLPNVLRTYLLRRTSRPGQD